ncbi:MAG TPA: ATP-binding protein [Rhodanobacter sp.]
MARIPLLGRAWRLARDAVGASYRWLQRVPVEDEIDYRNAPTMQLLFLIGAIALPLNWWWTLSHIQIRLSYLPLLVSDMATSAISVLGVVLIRHGRFRLAVKLYLGSLLLAILIGMGAVGFRSYSLDQTSQVLVLVIGALVMGRRTLWTVVGLLLLVFLYGFWVDAQKAVVAGLPPEPAFRYLPGVTFSYLLITLILDRTITALRQSLAESKRRGEELQREMAERARMQEQLVHAQKMEATGRLASGIAHDFNNLLSIVMGYAGERHRLDDPAPDAREDARALGVALEGVEDTAERGIALSRKLLAFSRPDPAIAAVFDAGEVLASMQPMLQRLFPADVRVRVLPAETALPVFMDRAQFELMLLNIASNARDAMPDGGEFRVSAWRDEMARTVSIDLTDNGHGMDERIQRHVFEPFFTTKPAVSGTGLGLSVTHSLVAAAGGDILLRSARGEGTTFTLRLPLIDAGADASGERGLPGDPDR